MLARRQGEAAQQLQCREPRPGATASIAPMNRRCSPSGSISGTPQITVPICPCRGQQIRQDAGVAGHHLHPGQGGAQMGGHAGHDLDHRQPLGRDAAGQQRAADDAGAGARLHNPLVPGAPHRGRDAPA